MSASGSTCSPRRLAPPRPSRRRRPPAAARLGEVETTGVGPTTEISRPAASTTAVVEPRTSGGDAAQRVVAVPPGDLDERGAGAARRAPGRTPATASSPRRERRLQRADEEVGGGDVRRPAPAQATLDRAVRAAASTAGISAAGSACARLPTVVPRLRIDRVGDVAAAPGAAAAGRRARLVGAPPGRAGRARRPGRRPRRRATSASSASRLMSTRWPGAASRMLSIGIRLWPPASTLPSRRPRRGGRPPDGSGRGSERRGLHRRSCSDAGVRGGSSARRGASRRRPAPVPSCRPVGGGHVGPTRRVPCVRSA